MHTNERRSPSWRRASACNPNGNCVEINRTTADHVAVRDSKQPAHGTLRFNSESWSAFLAVVTHVSLV